MENIRQIKTIGNEEYIIKPPKKYKNKWLIFPDSVFLSPDISDCNDTTTGICRRDFTLEQCIDDCEQDYKCEAGYFVKEKDKKQGWCVPIRTYVHPDLSPNYRLRKKDTYPFLKDDSVYSFVNKN